MKRCVTTGLVLIGLALSSCGGGGDEKKATTSPPPGPSVEPPSASTTPPGAAGQFPPDFLECMADQGVDIEQPSAIHSPGAQRAFQACLPFLHGGGAP